MDGLIKGLVNVAIDAVLERQGDDQHPHRNEHEQPRSSWAEVASSHHQDPSSDHGSSSSERPQFYAPNPSIHEVKKGNSADIEPTREEINNLSKACNKLWELDLNGLVPGRDYQINLGRGKGGTGGGDVAAEPLFTWVKEEVFKRPTYSLFSSLLNNYDPNQGRREVVTQEELREQDAFIEEASKTAPIKYVYKVLSQRGKGFGSFEGFKKKIKSLWFDLYSRAGVEGSSSAFEHVFVGEVRPSESEVSGFHNWITFYLEESKGRLNYRGHIRPRRGSESPNDETKLLTIQFQWNGILKPISSMIVGASPEFELALYTLVFYLGETDNHVNLGPYPVNIKVYRLEGNRIGSAFPIS